MGSLGRFEFLHRPEKFLVPLNERHSLLTALGGFAHLLLILLHLFLHRRTPDCDNGGTSNPFDGSLFDLHFEIAPTGAELVSAQGNIGKDALELLVLKFIDEGGDIDASFSLPMLQRRFGQRSDSLIRKFCRQEIRCYESDYVGLILKE